MTINRKEVKQVSLIDERKNNSLVDRSMMISYEIEHVSEKTIM